jgi:ABC-type sugar transport system permease subunit
VHRSCGASLEFPDYTQKPYLSTDVDGPQHFIAIAGIWKTFSLVALITLAGLQNVSRDLGETAAVDGAGAFSRFRAATCR